MANLSKITAIILNFTSDAMHDTYDGGGFESYDATELRVTAPRELRDSELTIYHNDPVEEGSLWRKVGQRIVFDIDRKKLDGSVTLFDAALSNVRPEVPQSTQ